MPALAALKVSSEAVTDCTAIKKATRATISSTAVHLSGFHRFPRLFFTQNELTQLSSCNWFTPCFYHVQRQVNHHGNSLGSLTMFASDIRYIQIWCHVQENEDDAPLKTTCLLLLRCKALGNWPCVQFKLDSNQNWSS